MKDFRVILTIGEAEISFFMQAKNRHAARLLVAEMHPGAEITHLVPIEEERVCISH